MAARIASVHTRGSLLGMIASRSPLSLVIAMLAGSVLIASTAAITFRLPFSPVPVTGQTFAILLLGATLGSRLGPATVLAYLAEGLVGLPVFAGGTNAWSPSAVPGVPVVLGPTAGYLIGFVVAAFMAGWFCERGFDRRIAGVVISLGLADLAIYCVALPWLSRFVGIERVYTLGMQPFLLGDGLKIALAACVLPAAWRVVRWRN